MADRAYVFLMEIEFRIDGAFSLIDKKKVVKSIIDYARNTLKITSAEISKNDMKNFAHLGFVTISNDRQTSKYILKNLFRRIDQNYPVEITKYFIEVI